MNIFYLSLVIGSIVLALFMSYATYDANLIKSSYLIALQQNENKFNPDVEWIGNKVTTIFDSSIAEDIESAFLLA